MSTSSPSRSSTLRDDESHHESDMESKYSSPSKSKLSQQTPSPSPSAPLPFSSTAPLTVNSSYSPSHTHSHTHRSTFLSPTPSRSSTLLSPRPPPSSPAVPPSLLQSLRGVKDLVLSDRYLQDEQMEFLFRRLINENIILFSLDLRGNSIGPKGIKHLNSYVSRDECQLQTLILEWNHPIHEHLQYSVPEKSFSSSTDISLSSPSSTSSSLSSASFRVSHDEFSHFCFTLRNNKSLTHIDFRNCKLSGECCDSLGKMIQMNRHIEFLDLRWNSINARGGEILAEAMVYNDNIQHLLLTGNKIPMETLKMIEEACEKNKQRKWKKMKESEEEREERRKRGEDPNGNSSFAELRMELNRVNDKYSELKELYENEKKISSSSLQSKSEEIEFLLLKHRENQNQIEIIKSNKSSLESVNLSLNTEISRVTHELSLLQGEFDILSHANKHEKSLYENDKNKLLVEMEKQRGRFDIEKNDLIHQNDFLQGEIRRIKEIQNSKMESENLRMEEKYSKFQEEFSHQKEEWKGLLQNYQHKYNKTKEEYVTLSLQHEKLNDTLMKIQHEYDDMKKDKESLEEEKHEGKMMKMVHLMEERLEEMKKQRDEEMEDRKKWKEEMMEKDQQIESERAQRKEFQRGEREMKMEIKMLHGEVEKAKRDRDQQVEHHTHSMEQLLLSHEAAMRALESTNHSQHDNILRLQSIILTLQKHVVILEGEKEKRDFALNNTISTLKSSIQHIENHHANLGNTTSQREREKRETMASSPSPSPSPMTMNITHHISPTNPSVVSASSSPIPSHQFQEDLTQTSTLSSSSSPSPSVPTDNSQNNKYFNNKNLLNDFNHNSMPSASSLTSNYHNETQTLHPSSSVSRTSLSISTPSTLSSPLPHPQPSSSPLPSSLRAPRYSTIRPSISGTPLPLPPQEKKTNVEEEDDDEEEIDVEVDDD